MRRFYEGGAWLATVVGVTLLIVSLVLVPQTRLLADDGSDEDAICMNPSCNTAYCLLAPCVTFGNNCKQTSEPSTCGGCKCKPDVADYCQCYV